MRFTCITPTRNESWIIDRFLAAAGCWADDIVVADQRSTDGTLEILQANQKVRLVRNEHGGYDERHRQQLLLKEARKIAGKRVLIALDADEALSTNCKDSIEWQKIAAAEPGTVLRFRWVNVLSGFERAWVGPELIPCGFIDDGSEHSGRTVHSPRVPIPDGAPVLDLHEIVVLHFQYVVPERVVSKHRWYQAWEYAEHRQKGALDIFRMYNHMNGSWERSEIIPFESVWLEGYDRAGIDFRSLKCEAVTWWDREVLSMLEAYGPDAFRRVCLWDKDWDALSMALERVPVRALVDPRSASEKVAHWLLKVTQEYRSTLPVRMFEKFLRLRGW